METRRHAEPVQCRYNANTERSSSTKSSCFADDEGSFNDASTIQSESSTQGPSVHFCGTVTVCDIESLNDLSNAQIEQTWFTANDYKRIRGELRDSAAMLEHGCDEIEQKLKDICMRGVECRTKPGIERKRNNRIKAYEAVLMEQAYHTMDSSSCPYSFQQERIAARYSDVTSACRRDARIQGLKDAEEARGENHTSSKTSLTCVMEKMHSKKKNGGCPIDGDDSMLLSPTSVCDPMNNACGLGYSAGSESERFSLSDSLRMYKSLPSSRRRGRPFGIHRKGVRPF